MNPIFVCGKAGFLVIILSFSNYRKKKEKGPKDIHHQDRNIKLNAVLSVDSSQKGENDVAHLKKYQSMNLQLNLPALRLPNGIVVLGVSGKELSGSGGRATTLYIAPPPIMVMSCRCNVIVLGMSCGNVFAGANAKLKLGFKPIFAQKTALLCDILSVTMSHLHDHHIEDEALQCLCWGQDFPTGQLAGAGKSPQNWGAHPYMETGNPI